MDIKKVNPAMNLEKIAAPVTNTPAVKKETEDVKVQVVVKNNLSTKKGIVSDVELNSILENIAAAESKVTDVEKAQEMIRNANSNILAAKNDAVLSQANQSKDVVEKLTK